MELVIIAAVSENNVIGKNGRIPWHIPEDLKRFKQLTSEYPVIMGRSTYESIGRPLNKRVNIIITSREVHSGIIKVKNPIEAITSAMELKCGKAYIIGGEKVYEEFMFFANKLEITKVTGNYLGDRFFPKINPQVWEKTYEEPHKSFSFETYKRKINK